MLRSLSFSGSERKLSTKNPVQRLWRYLSSTELSGYKSELTLNPDQIVDDNHPLGLGNPKILNAILSHLDAKDLVRARRVSLRWNHVACNLLRRKLEYCQLRPSRIKQFLRLMRRSISSPFGSFAIRIDNLRDLHVKNFFKRFSSDVIKLRVRIASDEIPDFFNRVLKTLDNLEELHLIRVPEEAIFLRSDYLTPSAWSYGIYHFPNLKAIYFDNDDPCIEFVRNYDEIIAQVVNSSPNLLKIGFSNWNGSDFANRISRCGITNPKSFDGWKISTKDQGPKEDLIELFYVYKMKFKALKFFIEPKFNFELAMDLTLQTGESLYHLSLKNENRTDIFTSSLQLNLLVTLSLQGWKGPVCFSGWQYQFPSLKTVKLTASNFDENSDQSVDEVMKTVTFLTVMPLDGTENDPVGDKLMINIVKMFPSITELNVQVNENSALHIVYKEWSRLSRLWVDARGNDFDDEAFTGIPNHLLKVIGQWECGCRNVSFPDEERRPTSISDLKALKELIIRAGSLSDVTLFEGISNLEKLEVLWLLPSFHVAARINSFSDDESPFQEHKNNDTSHNVGELIIGSGCNGVPKPWLCLRAIADSFKRLRHLVTPIDSLYDTSDIDYLMEKLPHLRYETRF